MTPQHKTTMLKNFIGAAQLAAMKDLSVGEEGEFFLKKMDEIIETLTSMPQTYETEGQGSDAIVHLHYFAGGRDWYITERDIEFNNQIQASGYADMGRGEFGYINIKDIIRNGAELDLYFEKLPISDIIAQRKKNRMGM